MKKQASLSKANAA